MDDVQLANYTAGTDPGPVEVWRADAVMALALGVGRGTVVWLSDYTLTKISFTHPEIDFRDYTRLPDILSKGFMTRGNRPRSVEICYVDTHGTRYRYWRVCLKATSRGEIFVSTIHRSGVDDFRRLYRRAARRNSLIKDHKSELARHLLMGHASRT